MSLDPWYKVYYTANKKSSGHIILRAPFAIEAKARALVILAHDNDLRFFQTIEYVKVERFSQLDYRDIKAALKILKKSYDKKTKTKTAQA